jgi:hypothetical protein
VKQILVPISFSKASKNSLCHAVSVFKKARLTLLHTYPVRKYNRKYDFGKKSYVKGISEKLWKFYAKHIESPDKRTKLIVRTGAVSKAVDNISHHYDLMIMSRKAHPKKDKGYFGEKKLFITTMAHCPVLIMPFTKKPFSFETCEHIWHIQRKETERAIVKKGIKNLKIDPATMEVKSLVQSSFLSAFWKNMVAYQKSHDEKLIAKIDKAHDKEPIDLIILVDNDQSTFTNFFNSDIIHLFYKYDIPILVFPTA